jgi:hypothetical protein
MRTQKAKETDTNHTSSLTNVLPHAKKSFAQKQLPDKISAMASTSTFPFELEHVVQVLFVHPP